MQRGSAEWGRIESQLQSSLPGADIVQLLRVQNKSLNKKYLFNKGHMEEINGAAPLEMWLWHGALPPVLWSSWACT